jgi:hypothetical protein
MLVPKSAILLGFLSSAVVAEGPLSPKDYWRRGRDSLPRYTQSEIKIWKRVS